MSDEAEESVRLSVERIELFDSNSRLCVCCERATDFLMKIKVLIEPLKKLTFPQCSQPTLFPMALKRVLINAINKSQLHRDCCYYPLVLFFFESTCPRPVDESCSHKSVIMTGRNEKRFTRNLPENHPEGRCMHYTHNRHTLTHTQMSLQLA